MHDGSITFSTALDNAQLEKDLAGLTKKIEKQEQKIADLTVKRDKAKEKGLLDMKTLDAEKAKLQEIKDQLAEIRAVAKDKSYSTGTREEAKAQIPMVQEELREQQTRVNALQTEWNKTENAVDRYATQLSDAEAALERMKGEAGYLQEQINAADQARTEALQSAEVADQHIVDLNRELLELKERQKELEGMGLGLGYEEYDQTVARISEITKELKEYQKALNETAPAADQAAKKVASVFDMASSAAKGNAASARKRLGSVISSLVNKMSGIYGGLKKAAPAAKKFGRAAVSAFSRAVMGIAELLSKVNVFPKMFSSVGKSLKKIGQMIRRVFVFSVITAGLRAIRTQMGAYLSINAEFSGALSRLKGVLLTAFQPIYDVVVPALTTLINVLSRVIAAITQFTAVLFGTTAKRAQKNAQALYSQAKATKAAGSAAEEAAGSLASFDEINTISTENSSGGGSSSAENGPLFDWEYEDTPFPDWGEAFDAFLDKILGNIPKLKEAFKNFADWLNDLSRKFYDMFTFPGVLDKVKQIGHDLADAFNDLVNWIDWNLLGKALGAGLNLVLSFLTSFIYEFDWINLGRKLAEFVNGLASGIDWYEFGRLLWSGFKIGLETLAGLILGLDMPELARAASNIAIGFFNSIKETIAKIDWAGIGRQIAEFLNNIDWAGVIRSIAGALKEMVGAAIDLIGGFIESADTTTLLVAAVFFGSKLLGKIGSIVLAPIAKEIGSSLIKQIAEAIMGGGSGGILASIGSALSSVATAISGVLSTIAPFAAAAGGAFLAVYNFVTMLSDGFNWLNEVLMLLGIAIAAVGAVILGIPAAIAAAVAAVVAAIATAIVLIKEHWEEIGEFFSQLWENIATWAVEAWDGICEYWGGVGKWWNENVITPIADFFTQLGEDIATWASETWGSIVSVWESVSGWFDENVIQPVSQFFSDMWDGIMQWAKDTWDNIVQAFQDAGNWFKEYVADPIGKAFEAAAEFVKGAINGIIGTVEGMVNAVIKAINWLISQLNKLKIDIPDNPITGALSIGFNIPSISEVQIPRLAQGAVIPPNREFMAVLGDQSSGNNLEAPESLIRKIVREESGGGNTELLQAILEAIKAGHIIMVDRRVLGQTVTDEQKRMTRQSGRPVVLG